VKFLSALLIGSAASCPRLLTAPRPVSRSRFLPTPADSVVSRRQPTHIG